MTLRTVPVRTGISSQSAKNKYNTLLCSLWKCEQEIVPRSFGIALTGVTLAAIGDDTPVLGSYTPAPFTALVFVENDIHKSMITGSLDCSYFRSHMEVL